MYEKVYGPKYEATKGLTVVEVAKLLRAEIKSAVKSGKLPKGKYSVRSDHNHIGIEIGGLALARIFSDERLAFDDHGIFGHRERYAPEMAAAMKFLEGLHDAYNYDGSDISSDYFNVRYYGGVILDHKWSEPVLEAEKAEMLAKEAAALATYKATHAAALPPLDFDAMTDEEIFAAAVKEAAKHGTVPIPAPTTKPTLYLVPNMSNDPGDGHLDYLAHLGVL